MVPCRLRHPPLTPADKAPSTAAAGGAADSGQALVVAELLPVLTRSLYTQALARADPKIFQRRLIQVPPVDASPNPATILFYENS